MKKIKLLFMRIFGVHSPSMMKFGYDYYEDEERFI
jgi:hypothetical protein